MKHRRYIDADALINEIKKHAEVVTDSWSAGNWYALSVSKVITLVEYAPTADVVEKERYVRCRENANILADALSEYQSADAVEVVRCKDCAYKQYYFTNDMVKCGCGNGAHHEGFFCADGERRDNVEIH